MGKSICLLCLKGFDEEHSSSDEGGSGPPLLTKFLKFAQNYLQVSAVPSEQLLLMSSDDGSEVFCEKCELVLINPICQVYSQLLATQLRLSWELEQLEKLLMNSQSSLKLNLLTDRLGIQHLSQLETFRHSLITKCQLKRMETLPQVFVERLMLVSTSNSELHSNQDEPSVKLESDELYEDHDDADDIDFNALAVDISYSLQSNSDDNLSLEIPTTSEEIDVKLEIVHESQEFPIKSEDTDEVNDPTFRPDALQSFKVIPKKKSTFGQAQFSCPNCCKTFPTREKMKIHSYRAHSGRRFKCLQLQCKAIFKSKDALDRHVAYIHNAKPQTCEQCKKVLRNEKYYRDHVARLHPDPLQCQNWPKCPKCGRSFHKVYAVTKHVLTCTGVKAAIMPPRIKTGAIHKKFPCNDCNESFPIYHLLQKHIAAFHSQKVALAFGKITEMCLQKKLKQ